MKKNISLLLTFAMVFSMFSTWSLPAYAKDKDLPNSVVTEIDQIQTPAVEEKAESTVQPIRTPAVEEKAELTVQPTQTPAVEEKVFDVKAAYEYANTLNTEEEQNAYIASLKREEKEQLLAYAEEIAKSESKEEYIPETVSVTKAGPFMPAVNVAVSIVANTLEAVDDGIELSKDIKMNPDGTYKITLESYTTGTVKTETKSSPVDIALVLDQSGSMDYDFAGKTRQSAMKEAVNKFIDEVAGKYSADADHRISLIEFRSDAKILKGWTMADATGAASLKREINSLNAEGATNVGAGMQEAEILMGSKYNYTGKNTERQKVVIVFTDGVPTTSNEFHTGVANTAITSAKNLKDTGVTVYSIGIFDGANPNQTYGDSGFKHNSDGKVGSKWFDKEGWISGGLGRVDIPAGNRFLNYVSSNYKDTTQIGIEEYFKPGLFYNDSGWKITKNFDRTAPVDENYYLSAKNSAELNNIFTTISEQINTPTINLGTDTVVKDIVTERFIIPEGATINLYTQEYKGSGIWEERKDATGLKTNISGNTVTVEGFDYTANFVTENAKADGSFGKKLIVEFDIARAPGYIGGNNVETNGADSGIYIPKEERPLDVFPVPNVNIPLITDVSEIVNKNIYLGGSADFKVFVDDYGNTVIDGLINKDVDLVYNVYVKGEDGNFEISPKYSYPIKAGTKPNKDFFVFNDIKDDAEYKVEVTVTPVRNGEHANAGSAITTGTYKTSEGKVNVFKPVVTFKDLGIHLGNNVTGLEKAKSGEQWKHYDTLDTTVTMDGSKPELIHVYDAEKAKADNVDDIKVNVTTKIGQVSIENDIIYIHDGCEGVAENLGTAEFLLHVKIPSLSSKFVDLGVYHNNDYPKHEDIAIKEGEPTFGDWKFAKEGITSTITMVDTKPTAELTVSYEFGYAEGKKIASTEDIPVKAIIKVGDVVAKEIPNAFELIVHTPVLKFRDSYEVFGSAINNATDYYNKENYISDDTVWKAKGTQAIPAEKMIGPAPELTFTYTPEVASWYKDGAVIAKADFYVNVEVKANGSDIPVEFVHVSYTSSPHKGGECLYPFNKDNGEFIVHIDVLETSLTLKKVVTGKVNSNDSFVFSIEGTDKDNLPFKAEVVLKAGESVIINGLRPNTQITVREDTDWSNRYTTTEASKTITLSAKADDNNITITNEKTAEKWLQGEISVENIFTKEAVR